MRRAYVVQLFFPGLNKHMLAFMPPERLEPVEFVEIGNEEDGAEDRHAGLVFTHVLSAEQSAIATSVSFGQFEVEGEFPHVIVTELDAADHI